MKHKLRLVVASVLVPVLAMAQWPESHAEDASAAPLQGSLDPGYSLWLSQVEDSDFDGNGESSMLKFESTWAAAYFGQGFFGGDVSVDFFLNSTFPLSSTSLKLPDQLIQLAMDLELLWRYENGSVFQVDLEPGYYFDMEDFSFDGIFFPFSLAVAIPLNPDLAGVIGSHVRPGFERGFLPILGVDWSISEAVDLQLQMPESRLTWYAAERWIFTLGFEWISESYALEKNGGLDRKMLTFESIDMEAGVVFRLNDEMRLALVYGESTEREVEFEKTGMMLPRVSDIDDGQYLKLGLLGPL